MTFDIFFLFPESLKKQLKYIEQFNELLKDTETIALRYIKLHLIGLSGLGKTTFRKRLLGQFANLASLLPQDRKQQSTLLAECNQVLAVSSDSKLILKASNDIKKETQLIFQYLIGLQNVSKAATSKPGNEDIADSKQTKPKERAIDSDPKEKLVEEISRQKDEPETKIDKVIEDLRDIIKCGNYTEQLVGKTLLNLMDIGGQPGFMEMLPFLSKGPGVFLTFFPLDKDLDELYEVTYERDEDKITPYQDKYTIRETVSQVLSAISHHVTIDSDLPSEIGDKFNNFSDLQAVVSLMGTFQDKLEIESKAEVLQARLKGDYPSLDESILTAAIQLILVVQQEIGFDEKPVAQDVLSQLETKIDQQLEMESFPKELQMHIQQKADETTAEACTETQQMPTREDIEFRSKIEVLEKRLSSELRDTLKHNTPKAVCLSLQMKQSNESLSKMASVVSKQLSTDSTIQVEAAERLQVVLQKKHKALSAITSKFEDVINHPGGLQFFPIDNFKGTDADIDPIRAHLQVVFDKFFHKASLPIRPVQLLFSVVLRKEFDIVTMEECFRIGQVLSMNVEEVKFTIWYLHHCVGALLSYPEINDPWFQDHVICSPNVIFNSISRLVVEPLLHLHSFGQTSDFTIADVTLWKKGQFSLSTVERCQSKSKKAKVKEDQLIPVNKLVMLLEHARLAAPIRGQGSKLVYFMPAILQCASKRELSKAPSIDSNTPSPIKLTFKSGYVPIGVFCATISRLVSEGANGIHGMKWNLQGSRVMRNLVSFEVDSAKHLVTLVAHADCYEIRLISRENCDLHELCSYVLTTLLFVLNEISRKIDPIIAFDCECPDHQKLGGNVLCRLEGCDLAFRCEHGRVAKLPPQQECWFAQVLYSIL